MLETQPKKPIYEGPLSEIGNRGNRENRGNSELILYDVVGKHFWFSMTEH